MQPDLVQLADRRELPDLEAERQALSKRLIGRPSNRAKLADLTKRALRLEVERR